jgi:hypothetical protein
MLNFVEGGKPENSWQGREPTNNSGAEDRTHDALEPSGERRAYYRNATHATHFLKTNILSCKNISLFLPKMVAVRNLTN